MASFPMVYPRVCGGTASYKRQRTGCLGLSPRVRGNPKTLEAATVDGRSIPACAGEPRRRRCDSLPSRVYPRVCGGTLGAALLEAGVKGLSPRVRGNLVVGAEDLHLRRSIPACAGEPGARIAWRTCSAVYPRVCGGTKRIGQIDEAAAGLSPRVRGNRSTRVKYERIQGSIPACAGEPSCRPSRQRPRPVYPRVCGGTSPPLLRSSNAGGLSPRVRGNHSSTTSSNVPARSIPACAGEPLQMQSFLAPGKVYPRVCGGTASNAVISCSREGLSPRVRGNLQRGLDKSGDFRSIPACAGEPSARKRRTWAQTVYPRVCGGTTVWAALVAYVIGLSPRVRGNLACTSSCSMVLGSIPACAGEPSCKNAGLRRPTVYPRVCGGTQWARVGAAPDTGLSPRVRGNPLQRSPRRSDWRSIPACAGEPRVWECWRAVREVYPRVCGGTAVSMITPDGVPGLSPRVRGNPEEYLRTHFIRRSIPACAGEPVPACLSRSRVQVYPRVCGGTSPYRK